LHCSAKSFARAAAVAPHSATALLGVMQAQRDLSAIGIDKIAHDVTRPIALPHMNAVIIALLSRFCPRWAMPSPRVLHLAPRTRWTTCCSRVQCSAWLLTALWVKVFFSPPLFCPRSSRVLTFLQACST
jgi:hypothetical protein